MLTKIHHIGIVVRSADSALRMYRDAFGLRVTKDAVLSDQGVRGVLLNAGESEIELLEPTREDTGVARFLQSRGEGMHHLCFASTDVARDLSDARDAGLTLIDEQPRPGLAGLIAFLHPSATRGVLVEYAQPPDAEASEPVPESDSALHFDHVTIATTALHATVQTYTGNFGLHVESQDESTSHGQGTAIFPIGRAFIELAVLPLEAAIPAGFPAVQNEGLYSLALATRDLQGAISRMKEYGVSVNGTVQGGELYRCFLSPDESHGVPIEFVRR